MTQIQSLFAVDSVDALVVDVPALTSQQHMDAQIAVTYPYGGNLANALPQCPIIFPDGSVVVHGPPQADHLAGPPFPHAIS